MVHPCLVEIRGRRIPGLGWCDRGKGEYWVVLIVPVIRLIPQQIVGTFQTTVLPRTSKGGACCVLMRRARNALAVVVVVAAAGVDRQPCYNQKRSLCVGGGGDGACCRAFGVPRQRLNAQEEKTQPKEPSTASLCITLARTGGNHHSVKMVQKGWEVLLSTEA